MTPALHQLQPHSTLRVRVLGATVDEQLDAQPERPSSPVTCEFRCCSEQTCVRAVRSERACVPMAVRFWEELAPGKAYKLMVPEDVELQINQAASARTVAYVAAQRVSLPLSRLRWRRAAEGTAAGQQQGCSRHCCPCERQDSRTSMLTVKQLDDDGDDEDEEEMCVARLSMDGVDCRKSAPVPVRSIFGTDRIVTEATYALRALHLRTAGRRWSSSKRTAATQCTSPVRCLCVRGCLKTQTQVSE